MKCVFYGERGYDRTVRGSIDTNLFVRFDIEGSEDAVEAAEDVCKMGPPNPRLYGAHEGLVWPSNRTGNGEKEIPGRALTSARDVGLCTACLQAPKPFTVAHVERSLEGWHRSNDVAVFVGQHDHPRIGKGARQPQ
jgi:hypothetical protein